MSGWGCQVRKSPKGRTESMHRYLAASTANGMVKANFCSGNVSDALGRNHDRPPGSPSQHPAWTGNNKIKR